MQFSKKLFTATIATLLLVSAIATIIPVFADNMPPLTTNISSGPVGSTVYIWATDTTAPGSIINVYWENTGGLLLKSGYADGNGYFNLSVTIPDATAGVHALIAQDAQPTTNAINFTVTSSVTVNPIRGIPGDTVNVTGSGFNSSSLSSARGNITVAFYNASGTVYSTVLGAINTTSTGNFSILVTVPVVDYGSYNISATDQSLPTPKTATTIFTVSAIILINGANSASVPSGSVVTITGRGFSKQAGLLVNVSVGTTRAVEPTQILTVADGTFSGTFIVPTLSNNVRYAVNAVDPNFTATTGSSSFPAAGLLVRGTTGITVTPTSGAPGTAVTLTGQNFTYIAGTTVTVRFGLTPAGTLQIATFTTSATGGFSGSITVPTLPTGSPYYFNATDSNALQAQTTFAIAITALFLSPTSGPSGQVVAMTAFGLGTTGATTFNVTIGGAVLTPSSNLVSAIAGGTATVTVPTMPVGTYNVVATDNLGLSASAAFVVTATSTLTVNPSTAPVGVSGVTLTLTNFGAGAPVSYFIANATSAYPLTVTPGPGFVTLTTNASGTLLALFTVPGLALGPYTITANETTGQWNATAAYTVGAVTLNINPRATTYVQGSVLSFNIQSTFAASFTINIYDPAGTAGFMSISSSLFVPVGNLWVYPYETGSMWGYTNGAEWVIPNDAVTGTWTWNATITSLGAVVSGSFTVLSSSAASNTTNTDLSNAIASVNRTVNTINTNVLALNATVIAINGNIATLSTNTGYILSNVTAIRANITSIMGSIATVQTSLGTLQTSVSSINANITGVNNGLATVTTSVGTLTTSVNSLGSTLTSVSGTVGTISTSVGSLTTSLSSLDTKVTGISGTVATIHTDLGTLTGTVTSIQGNVATIQTNLGTLQADVSSLKTDVDSVPGQVLIPIWIAVVLALIAAIAAIASLLLVRRKIAG